MALARYGRQALDYWDDRDINELRAWHDTLAELMKEESSSSGATEE